MIGKSGKDVKRSSYSSNGHQVTMQAALEDALSVLGAENQESVLYLMRRRYHIDLERPASKDQVFLVLDDIFGVASYLIKQRVNAHLRLVSISSHAFAP